MKKEAELEVITMVVCQRGWAMKPKIPNTAVKMEKILARECNTTDTTPEILEIRPMVTKYILPNRGKSTKVRHTKQFYAICVGKKKRLISYHIDEKDSEKQTRCVLDTEHSSGKRGQPRPLPRNNLRAGPKKVPHPGFHQSTALELRTPQIKAKQHNNHLR